MTESEQRTFSAGERTCCRLYACSLVDNAASLPEIGVGSKKQWGFCSKKYVQSQNVDFQKILQFNFSKQ